VCSHWLLSVGEAVPCCLSQVPHDFAACSLCSCEGFLFPCANFLQACWMSTRIVDAANMMLPMVGLIEVSFLLARVF